MWGVLLKFLLGVFLSHAYKKHHMYITEDNALYWFDDDPGVQNCHRSGLLVYFFSQDSLVAPNFFFLFFHSSAFYENCLIRHADKRKKHISFCQEVIRTDKSVAGKEINKEGLAGMSGWVDIYCH